jgi:uncharacterized protein YjbJ (UPF0337 family)
MRNKGKLRSSPVTSFLDNTLAEIERKQNELAAKVQERAELQDKIDKATRILPFPQA